MAEEGPGLEAVIKVTLDDSEIEGDAQRAAAKASKAKAKISLEVEDISATVAKSTRGKKVKVPVEITVDPAQASETVQKATRGKKSTITVTPVVEDSDLAKLKTRLAGARSAVGVTKEISKSDLGSGGEGARARALMGELRTLIRDLSAEVKRKEGKGGPGPKVPVTDQRIDEVAKLSRSLLRTTGAAGKATVGAPQDSGAQQPIVVVTTPVSATSRVSRATNSRLRGSLSSQLRQAMQMLHPVEAAASAERVSTAGTAIDPVTGQRYSAAEERAARGSVTPTAGTARAMGRVPMERTTRRGRARRANYPYRLSRFASDRPDTVFTGEPDAYMAEVGGRSTFTPGVPIMLEREGGRGRRRETRRYPGEMGPEDATLAEGKLQGTAHDAAVTLPGQVGTPAGRSRYRENLARMEAAARRGEAPATEDTFNPIGERTRQRAPRRGPITVDASQPWGRPSARGPGGVPAGEPLAKPRGRLRKILDALEARQFEDYFQNVDETGRIAGPAERASGTLAEAIKVDDPGYKQFAHEGRYFQRVSPYRVAEAEREQYLEEVSQQSSIPKLALIGKGGPLGAARTSRRKGETREQELARRGERQQFRQKTQSRTKEDVYRFNAWLGVSKSGEGLAPAHTGFMNAAQNVIPSEEPEPLSDAERATAARLMRGSAGSPSPEFRWTPPPLPELSKDTEPVEGSAEFDAKAQERMVAAQRAHREEADRIRAEYLQKHPESRVASGAGMSAEKTGALLAMARRARSKKRGYEARARIAKARGIRKIWVDDPTTAGLGTRGRQIETTAEDSRDAAMGRDVIEVINERLQPILKDYERGVTMTDTGPFGETPGQVGQSDIRGSGAPVLSGKMRAGSGGKLDSLGSFVTTLSPGRTAQRRFGQLIYDIAKSAKYSEQYARGLQSGKNKISNATKLDKSVREMLSGTQQALGHEAGAKRDAAEHLDSLQRDPPARGEKKKTWTEQDEPLEKLEQRLAELTGHFEVLSAGGKGVEFKTSEAGVSQKSPEEMEAIREVQDAFTKERRSLIAQRVWLRRKQEAAYGRVAQQTGGELQGERGGVRPVETPGGVRGVAGGGILGIVRRDRTRSKIARGRRIAGIDELVPSRGRAQFGEPRQNTGDEYAETVNATISGAGVNLSATPTRPAEEPIPDPLITPKSRFPLQNSTGAPVAGGRARAGGGGRGAAGPPRDTTTAADGPPPPTPPGGTPSAGGVIHVIVDDGKLSRVGSIGSVGNIAGGGRATAKTDPGDARMRRIANEWTKSLAGEPGSTPAAKASQFMAAMEPGKSAADIAKKLRELGFTEREAKEFSGLRDEERAAKATGRAAKPSSRASFPTIGPRAVDETHPGPMEYTLAGPSDDFTESPAERGRRAKRKRRQARSRLREDAASILAVDADPDRIAAEIARLKAKAPKASDQDLLKVLKKKGFEQIASREALGMASPLDRKASLQAILNRTEATVPGVRFLRNERDPSIKSDARIAAEAKILEARAGSPTRAFQTAVAAFFAKTLGGGGQFEIRARKTTRALNIQARAEDDLEENRQSKIYNRYNRMQTAKAIRGLEQTVDPSTQLSGWQPRRVREQWAREGTPVLPAPRKLTRKESAQLQELAGTEQSLAAERGEIGEQTPALQRKADRASDRAVKLEKKLMTPLGVARGFAMLGVGAIAGGMIYNAASKTIQGALGLLETQAARAADAFAGFALTASRVTADLAQVVKSAFGNQGAIAGAVAPSGIAASTLAALNARGLSGRAEAIAAAQNRVQESDLMRSAGYLGQNKLPGGYDRALFEGTGGILNTSLLAPQPGFLERISGDVVRNNTGISVGDVPQAVGDILGAGNPFGENFGDVYAQGDKRAKEAGAADNKIIFDDLNKQLARVTSSFSFLAGATDDQKKAMVDSAGRISDSAKGAAESFARAGYAIVGPNGQQLADTQFGAATQQLAQGQNTVDRATAFQADQRQLEAQVMAAQREMEDQLTRTIPRDRALANFVAPVTEEQVGAGIIGASPAEQKGIDAALSKTKAAQVSLNKEYEAGAEILRQSMIEAGAPPELLDSIKRIGEETSAIQAKIAAGQGKLQAHEYANQLRIAERSLSDIVGLMGKNKAHGASTLGILERENVMLSRQSELLGQMLQQRQINFQLATAGFIVAGQSPEERAARIKDAKTQAEFAQKQLDIQKKIFGIGIKVFDITNDRSYTDAKRAIGLLTEGRALTISTAVYAEELKVLGKTQDDNLKKAGAYLTKVDKGVAISFGELYKLEAAYGISIAKIGSDTLAQFSKDLAKMYAYINDYMGAGSNNPASDSYSGPPGGHASGALFNTTGATSMIVGEAGPETVAILRAPRSVTPTTSGGGGGITININHPVVRDDQDINKITASVVRAINTRTALLGLR